MSDETKENLPAMVPVRLDSGILPKDFDELNRFANLVQRGGLSPSSFNSVEKIAIGILTNMELGRPIITGLQDLAIINGRCGIYGDAALAMVTASGLMAEGYPIEEETGTPFKQDWTFKFKVKRKGGVERVGTFTWEEAIRAGFDDPKQRDGKPDRYSPWRRFPRRMMQWKSRNWILRDVFGDVLKGMKTVEDLHDLDGIPTLSPDHTGAYSTEDLTSKIQAGAETVVESGGDIKVEKEQKTESIVPEKTGKDENQGTKEKTAPPAKSTVKEPPQTIKVEKEKCPWPECNAYLMPGKGMSRHITQQHDGQYPPVILTVDDEPPADEPPEEEPPQQEEDNTEDEPTTEVETGFPDEDDEQPLFNPDGSINTKAKQNEDPVDEKTAMIMKIRKIPIEVKQAAYKRVGLDTTNPVLSVYDMGIVKEVFETCKTIAIEMMEGTHG